MRDVDIIRRDGKKESITAYSVEDFPYEKLEAPFQKMAHKRHGVKGLSTMYATFDIENTTYCNEKYNQWLADGKRYELMREDAPVGFLYHWQMTVGGIPVYGRYWIEWIEFMDRVKDALHLSREWVMIVYVHNLSHEFQFMRDILEEFFGGYTVFATARRKPVYVRTNNGFEFRCSYKLTNMSLAKASEFEREVVHIKAKGDLDYKKFRLPSTELTDEEFGYCISDVVSLHEIIASKLHTDYDTLETIPITSTGYVRRMLRNSCKAWPHYRQNIFNVNSMTMNVYLMLKEAGRGGNTHANRYMSGRVWSDVISYDEISGYPAMQLLMPEFPVRKFQYYGKIHSDEEFNSLLSEYACLFHVVFGNIRIKPNIPMPYIPVSKLLRWSNKIELDNGRILYSSGCSICLTNIDFEIIKQQYEWDDMIISDMHIAKKGYLPEPIRKVIHRLFVDKCEIKSKMKKATPGTEEYEDLEYIYGKTKNLLNGIFGCTYSDPIRDIIEIDRLNGQWTSKRPMDEELEEALMKYHSSRNSFLVYAWGVWTTALNRRHLETLLQATGGYGIGKGHCGAVIYCDTDSSKCINPDEELIAKLNADIVRMNEETGSYCDVDGKRYYIGLYDRENDEPYLNFKTLGAKKYAYTEADGSFHITVSGVQKKIGAAEMGSIENFRPGFVFKEAGGLTLYYNDDELGCHMTTIEGESFMTASNIGMVDSTYELGITSEYAELIGYNFLEEVDKKYNKL